MPRAFAKISFTPSVRAIQKKMGSADSYARFLKADADGGDQLSERESEFIGNRDGFYQATVSETAWPYVQFRGGPKGFLKVIDSKTIAYADFRGNRQYLSVGNLVENDRVSLILMDYPNRRRLKIWGRANIVELNQDRALATLLIDESYQASPERAIVIDIAAFDWNCPQHIPQRFTIDELKEPLAQLREEIARLQKENDRLNAAASPSR